MAYRVFDKKKKRWVDEKIYLSPDGELYKLTQTFLGQNKLTAVSQDRYVWQQSVDLYDKNGNMIYIGDNVKAQVDKDKTITGMVTYAEELSAFIILCFETNEFFTLGTDVCEFIEIIGNVFEETKSSKKKK